MDELHSQLQLILVLENSKRAGYSSIFYGRSKIKRK